MKVYPLRTFILICCALAYLLPANFGWAQEKDDPPNVPQHALGFYWNADPANGVKNNPYALGVPLFNLYTPSLASNDGKFLASNQRELWTYQTLGVQFQGIHHDYLRNQLGLSVDEGLFVTKVDESKKGHDLGLTVGDIVLKADDEPINDQNRLIAVLAEEKREPVRIVLLRKGQEIEYPLRFSINSNQVAETREAKTEKRRVLGIFGEQITDLAKSQLNLVGGLAVTGFSDESPAEAAGLMVHDIVVAIDGTDIRSLDDLHEVLASVEDQMTVRVDFVRVGKQLQIQFIPKTIDTQVMAGAYYFGVEGDPTIGYLANIEYDTAAPVIVNWNGQAAIKLSVDPDEKPNEDSALVRLEKLEAEIAELRKSIEVMLNSDK